MSDAMPAAAVPANEPARLARLRALDLLDSPPEALFDGFVRAAAAICDVPIAAISLLDADRQWFKAQVGLGELTQTPRSHAFCAHTVLGDDLLEVPDARDDPRFQDNPLVQRAPHIRFYAGVPLSLEGSLRVGTLCAIDSVPRRLTAAQARALRELAQTLSQAMMLRDPGRWSIAEEALMHSERKYRQLAESSPFGVFYAAPDGEGVYSNDRLREMFGIRAPQAVEARWQESILPEDLAAVSQAWATAIATGDDCACRYRIRRPDGSVRHVASHARPTRGADGAITGWVGVAIDETEHLLAEQGLREEYLERERLRRHANELSELLAERTAMIDVLAHEVRQPLSSAAAALDAATRVLERRCEGTALGDVQQARQVLAGVIEGVNNTLAVSTALMAGETVLVDADLDMLLSIAVGDLREAERSRVFIDRQTTLRTLCADVGLLRMALRNLLMNALRYSPADRPVCLRVTDAVSPGLVNIDVLDSGGGISPELLPHLFERGRRGDSTTTPGHGLGLFIARRAMELQQGHVDVLGSGPSGTVMRLRLMEH